MIDHRRQRGAVMVYVIIALIAFFGLAALATDGGFAWNTRGQVQNAADGSALAAAGELIKNSGLTLDKAGALASAQQVSQANPAAGVSVVLPAGDVTFGSWDLATRTFTPLPASTDVNLVRAVRTFTQRSAAQNGSIQTILGKVVGVNTIDVTTPATGYLGFAGVFPPGTIDLPLAIDCCFVSDPTCTQASCPGIASNPPFVCDPVGHPGMTCLEFDPQGTQNSCWTEFDTSSSVSTPALTDIVNNTNSFTITTSQVMLDNGDKVPVLQDIADRFYGDGLFAGNPAGTDTDGDGVSDTWVVGVAVVECQNPGDGCAGGSTQQIVGALCMDITEVETTGVSGGGKRLYVRFVCPGDPSFGQCSLNGGGVGPGGANFGVSASYPVLVE